MLCEKREEDTGSRKEEKYFYDIRNSIVYQEQSTHKSLTDITHL